MIYWIYSLIMGINLITFATQFNVDFVVFIGFLT